MGLCLDSGHSRQTEHMRAPVPINNYKVPSYAAQPTFNAQHGIYQSAPSYHSDNYAPSAPSAPSAPPAPSCESHMQPHDSTGSQHAQFSSLPPPQTQTFYPSQSAHPQAPFQSYPAGNVIYAAQPGPIVVSQPPPPVIVYQQPSRVVVYERPRPVNNGPSLATAALVGGLVGLAGAAVVENMAHSHHRRRHHHRW
eukprot:GILK01010970.1.p1 GENE.GILK01010970.1~~GILK01010970.1.p1  ORF type:complete len:195 (-),score=3.08 GILK01010970.1:283-867(-)